ENVIAGGPVRHPVGQIRIVRVSLDSRYPGWRKQYRYRQALLLVAVQHELDIFLGRLPEAPTAAYAGARRCPRRGRRSKKSVVIIIGGARSGTVVGILQFKQLLVVKLARNIEEVVVIVLQTEQTTANDLPGRVRHSVPIL